MNQHISIKEACSISGLSESYIRKEMKRGHLPYVQEHIADTDIPKDWIPVEAFEDWRASKKSRSRRADKRNKFVLYMNAEEVAELLAKLEGTEITQNLSRATQPKEV